MFGELGRTMEFLNYVHLPFGYLLPFIAALTIIVFIHDHESHFNKFKPWTANQHIIC